MSTAKQHSPSRPLHIAVLGVGGIGSTFAFHLTRAGHGVKAIARPGSLRLEQLKRDDGIVNTKGERAELGIADMLDETVPYDLVLVTPLANQVDAVLSALQRSAAKRIQFMLNTSDPERLRGAVGSERCSFGMPFVQAIVDWDGKLNAKIGMGGQKSKMNHQGWVNVFIAAGLPAVFEPDMLLWLRCHVPLCVAFESVSLAGMQRGGGASWSESLVIARGMQESVTSIRRLGYKLYPSGKSWLHANPVWVAASMLWSLSRIVSFRELLATGITECLALVDVLVAHASSVHFPIAVAKIQAMKPAEESRVL